MFEAAIPGKTDSSSVRQTGLSATQNVLLAFCDKAEIHRLEGYLGNIYHLFPVKTEWQFFDVLQNQPIDLVIINREEGKVEDGMQCCSRLKSSTPFAHLPVILLTPSNNAETRICCLQSGADAWMAKPVSRDYLRAQVRNLLANRRRVHSHLSRSLPLSRSLRSGKKDDSAFLNKLNRNIIEHLSDTGLNVGVLARLMNISLPTLYRKIRSVSDTTPNGLINIIRLNKAAELLSFGGYKVFEIVKMVGFHSRSNFGRAFMKQYGVTPKEYQQITGS